MHGGSNRLKLPGGGQLASLANGRDEGEGHSPFSGSSLRSHPAASGGVPRGDGGRRRILGGEPVASSLLSHLLFITLVFSFSTGTDLAERRGLISAASGASEARRWTDVTDVPL